ncbi:YqcI/YcgG family protein [Aurantimonas sp. DM33-3]|uniref:YqcI/YcgG family protein n=1 Tax=Aurantimonas sp. DM33-3 TaxID=2766955 RepID=UPI0016526019|nr:YqcI/YcgG family protein [Aurantimonas sp. DM33-3]MBC6718388.1 YqcI/YcgG family protein [Aurantimonas sp. DM33-3]
MDNFEALRVSTLCPFAVTSKIDYGPQWSDEIGFDENVALIADGLRHHLPRCRREQLQGFVAQIKVGDPTSFEQVVSCFRRLIFELGRHDSSCQHSLDGDIGAKEWNFTFGEEAIFLNLFAACYQWPHSKRVDDRYHMYVFFQPEFTFDFCNINRSRVALKEDIRRRFAAADMPYDGQTIDGRRKALAFVFPLKPCEPPVEWWRSAPPSHATPCS